MEPPSIRRQRLVRDYSTEDEPAPVQKEPQPEHRDHWHSPVRSVRDVPRKSMGSPAQDVVEIRKLDFTQDPPNKNNFYEASISTQPTSISGQTTTRMADFFSNEVFQVVLHNPTTAHQLKKFAQTRLNGENLEFLEKVDQYHTSLNQVTKTIFDIHRNFISVNAPAQVNLPEDVLIRVNKNLKQLLANTMPNMESVFVTAQHDIEQLVASEIYPRFVRYQMTMSASRALASNKNRYAGLGDCFVLTDPNKADNPIVYASDGFVNVTGHKRTDIIPRNCRFLQTSKTDPKSVQNIKKSLDHPAECVELLLNQRKNGEPFWNLLYTAPLYDSSGKLTYFIGGQIDVSTTIHNTSDILRTLSFNADENIQPKVTSPMGPPGARPQRQSFFSNFLRPKNSIMTIPEAPGMEPNLLDNLETLPFREQKEAFYTAYSKYIVINAETMLISYSSIGIRELFYPPTPTNQHRRAVGEVIGQDIFKFLSYHSASGLSRDYKSRVKGALRAGQAISADISLWTRRVSSFEKFATHWTPLKDEYNAVGFIVLTFGSETERSTRW